MDRLRRAREDLRDARARLRSRKVDAEGLRDAERAIERVSGEVAIGGPLGRLVAGRDAGVEEEQREPVRAPDLRKGARVWVSRLRAEADVVEVLHDGAVRVAAGPLKLTVPAGDLRAVTAPTPPPRAVRAVSARHLPAEGRPAVAGELTPIQTHDNTCDLRGLRIDDGVGMATSFLDRAVGGGQPVVFLLHGHGTGALRDAIRKELARSPYVARFRGGDPDQGGEGVTLVWLT
jgi:DNA mismatch repair protein MutS2